MSTAEDDELEDEEEELPAWSLPRAAADRIGIDNPLPERVDKKWALGGATGKGVKVCILDSGVEFGHPLVGELAGAVAITLDEEGDPVAEEDTEGDLCGHGTACAGVVRAIASPAGWASRWPGSAARPSPRPATASRRRASRPSPPSCSASIPG